MGRRAEQTSCGGGAVGFCILLACIQPPPSVMAAAPGAPPRLLR